MLCWIFGDVEENIVHLKTADVNAGSFKLKNANVRWFLSVNYEYIPEDVKEKLLTFTKAGLALAEMKGKSYLSMGSVSMGIAGSIVNEDFFQNYLGMRNEYVDMTEFTRRINENISG